MLADTWTTITTLFHILSFLKTLLNVLKLFFWLCLIFSFFSVIQGSVPRIHFNQLWPDQTTRRACFDSDRTNSSFCSFDIGTLHKTTKSWSTQGILWFNKLGKNKLQQCLKFVKNTNICQKEFIYSSLFGICNGLYIPYLSLAAGRCGKGNSGSNKSKY